VSDCHLPDGIVVDAEAPYLLDHMGIQVWMTGPSSGADIDGKNRKTIVPQGKTHTPKQIILDKKGGTLYWCDREGMRVMRCNLDGSRLETLIEAGRGEADSRDQTRWCVGLTIDPKFGTYLLDRKKALDNAGLGRLFRANVEIPPVKPQRPGPTSKSSTTACRTDRSRARPQEPILYWTDRGDRRAATR